jgi:hypothetical protein
MPSRADILAQIEAERERQFNLPGSEWDIDNTPNEWVAIAGHYLFEQVRRGSNPPAREEFADSLVKTAALVIAALEAIPVMDEKDLFRDSKGGGFDLNTELKK